MPRGDKSKYTAKQERKADHITESYEARGVPELEAERRAWATVNKDDGGGKRAGGSGQGKLTGHRPRIAAANSAARRRRHDPRRAARRRRGRRPRRASATSNTRTAECATPAGYATTKAVAIGSGLPADGVLVFNRMTERTAA